MAYQPVTRAELATKTSPRPGTRALHDVIVWHFHGQGARSGGIYNRRKVRGGTSWSLHAVGRALDVMVPNRDVGWEIALRAIRAADALGVSEVIFERTRWTAEHGPSPYRGSNPHLDHVHIGQTVDMADRPDTSELRRWFSAFLMR